MKKQHNIQVNWSDNTIYIYTLKSKPIELKGCIEKKKFLLWKTYGFIRVYKERHFNL
jgi:hypothetical protein